MEKQEFLKLFSEKLANDELSFQAREMLSAYFDVLSSENRSDQEILSLCDPESFEPERQRPSQPWNAPDTQQKPYYDFSINDLKNRTCGPYDVRYFKVHIIRSGKLTFKNILSESQIIFAVSTSGKITLEGATRAEDTFTLDVSTTGGINVCDLWARHLRADIYTGIVSLTFRDVLPLTDYPSNPMFYIDLHNYGRLNIRFARGQKVVLCNRSKGNVDCRVEQLSSVAGGYPYIIADGGRSTSLTMTY